MSAFVCVCGAGGNSDGLSGMSYHDGRLSLRDVFAK